MLLKIQIPSVALTFRNAKIVLHHLEQSQEIKEIAGLNQLIQFGKSLNMVQFQELIK
jgi:hypothetical protein